MVGVVFELLLLNKLNVTPTNLKGTYMKRKQRTKERAREESAECSGNYVSVYSFIYSAAILHQQ